MLIFSAIFLLLSYGKYERSVIAVLRKYNDRQDSSLGESESNGNSTGDALADEAKKQAVKMKAQTEIMNIWQGEIAFLKEVKLQKER